MLRPPPHPLLASLFEGVWAAPWMLLWLPAVGLPFLISRWMAGPPTVVRWGPIDILARARRRIGANASGSPLSLLLIRSASVALTVVAAAQPLFPRPTMDRTAADPTRAATGDPTTAGRIILVAPSTGGMSKADGGPTSEPAAKSAFELAIDAIRASRPDAASLQVERLGPDDLAAAVESDMPTGSAAGMLIIAADGGLTAEGMRAATRVVDGGGSLLLLLGPRSVVAATVDRLSTWLGSVAGIEVAGRMDGEGARIEVDAALGEIGESLAATVPFVPLSGPTLTGFAELVIDRRPTDQPPEMGPTRVLARTLPGARPLVLERRRASGRIAAVALPCTLGNPASDWSDLAAWPVFVPIVDGLLERMLDGGTATANRMPRQVRHLEHRRSGPLDPAPLLLAVALGLALAEPAVSWWLANGQSANSWSASLWPSSLWHWLARWGGIAALATLLATVGSGDAALPVSLAPIPIRFLIDVSPSMATRDVIHRAAAVTGTASPIGRLRGLVDALAAHPPLTQGSSRPSLAVSYATIARDLVPLDLPGPDRLESLGPLPPEVDASRLGDAVEAAIVTGNPPPAVIVVASDGLITSGASWNHAAELALAAGVPLVAIPVGGEGDAGDDTLIPEDELRITAVDLPPLAFLGERLVVPVVASGRIRAADGMPVELTDRNGNAVAKGRLRRPPGAAAGDEPGAVASVAWTPAEIGPRSLVAQNYPSGAVHAVFAGTTQVIENPIRVLLIDGRPRFEFRFLEQLLSADRRFRIDSRLVGSARAGASDAGIGRFSAGLPDTVEGWNAYDLVVIGDLRGPDLPAGVASSLLAAARDEGIGLAWLPGRRWATGTASSDPFDDLVPGRAAARSMVPQRRRLEPLPAGRQSGWIPSGVAAAEGSRAMQVFDTVSLTALRPTARWLAVAVADDGDRQPAVLLDTIGRAQMLCLLCETWRADQSLFGGHGDFWRNALLRLAAGHALANLQPAAIEFRPARPTVGTALAVEIRTLRSSTDLRGWRLRHLRPDGSIADQALDAGRLRLDPVQPGWQSLVLLPPADGRPNGPPPIARDLFVPAAQSERPGRAADTRGMEAAAVASGGAVVRLDEMQSLGPTLTRLARVDRTGDDAAGRRSLLTGLLVAAAVAGCSVDWALRSRRGLP